MMRATLTDPAGPRWWRVLTMVGLAPLLALGLALPLPATARLVMALVGAAWFVCGRIVVPRLATKGASIELARTGVVVHRDDGMRQRLEPRDLEAASTAGDGAKASLALVRYAHGDWPMWLDLERPEDLEAVRRALGIPHGGFGEIVWPPRTGTFHLVPSWLDVAGLLAWIGVGVAVAVNSAVMGISLGALAAVLTLMAAFSASAHAVPVGEISLSPWGVRVGAGPTAQLLPWAQVRDVSVTDAGLEVVTDAARVDAPMPRATRKEREHFATQIACGIQRSRGEGLPVPGVPASLAVLLPRGEPPRAWLERIDAAAATLAQPQPHGYRSAGPEERELWEALESADAPPPVRAGAARVLARVAPAAAGPRIQQVLAQERDAGARDRIRIALEEDVEIAARELARLDR